MKSKTKNLFCSKECQLLFWLSEHSQKTSKGMVVNLSQEEIADECKSNPTTVNHWIRALKDTGCVEQVKKGSYSVTEIGNAVLAQMEKIDKIIGGIEL